MTERHRPSPSAPTAPSRRSAAAVPRGRRRAPQDRRWELTALIDVIADKPHGSTALAHAPVVEATVLGPPAPTRGEWAMAAFDVLYAGHAAALTRQAYLLTGRPERAREAVAWAFHLAWQRWPEVAVDPDPPGWVRAAVYEYALSPWHRLRPARRGADGAASGPSAVPLGPAQRALLDVLLELPAPYRRVLVLHDGVGLGVAEAAAEVEASVPATAGRLAYARQTVARRLPVLGLAELPWERQGAVLRPRLADLATSQPVAPPGAAAVRGGADRRIRWVTRGAFGLTALVAAATAFTLVTNPYPLGPPGGRPAAQPSAAPVVAVSPAAAPREVPDAAPPPADDPALSGLPPAARLVPEFR